MILKTTISPETLQDIIYIENGTYHPLRGFLTRDEYYSVLNNMLLKNKEPWSVPITLDVDAEVFKRAQKEDKLYFEYNGSLIGFMFIEDSFEIDVSQDCLTFFKTQDLKHPGVEKEMKRSQYRIGGVVKVTQNNILKNELNPISTQNYFKKQGWKTVLGFQTRNPIHRGHEYLQRIALTLCDGLFINPSIGWKKKGDFSEEAVMVAYKKMLAEFYPHNRVHLVGLKNVFRYAGPREAIFHALMRRNLGCTHFLIGRDHAGVGNFYEKYEAQELARELQKKVDLGITLVLTKEPFFCNACNQVATEECCAHEEGEHVTISGTAVRESFRRGKIPDNRFMRAEISEVILNLKKDIFI
ncbi:MAG: sulfate adenylyltransferase [Deltaproteobacteria bacterium]|nr:sulfate adenylyltransferase [Deltaproteobacteria bacterium]